MKVAEIDIYDDLGQKKIAFSYKAVVRSALTDPSLRIVVYGNTECVGPHSPRERTLISGTPGSQRGSKPARTCQERRGGGQSRTSFPGQRIRSLIILSVKVAEIDIHKDLGQEKIAFSYKAVVRSALTDPSLRIVVYGNTVCVGPHSPRERTLNLDTTG